MDNTNRNTKGWSSVVGGRMQEQINNFRYIAGFMYLHFSLFCASYFSESNSFKYGDNPVIFSFRSSGHPPPSPYNFSTLCSNVTLLSPLTVLVAALGPEIFLSSPNPEIIRN